MKILKYKAVALFSIVTLFCLSTVPASAASHSWYIKRNGNNCPSFPPNTEELQKYDCYWIDTKLKDSKEKRIYITFDAGYENGNIEKILDTLKEESVPAAFFLLDNIILKNTDLVNRMADEGHLVCNHTKNHKNLSEADSEEISNDLLALEKIYNDATGRDMAKYFRFPEGKYSLEAVKCISALGYKTVFWSFAYDDWDNSRQRSEQYAIKKVIDNTHNGAIMLFHPTSETNAKIFPTLIKMWRDMGYEFGTLDELTDA